MKSILLLLCAVAASAQDAKQILVKAMEHDERNLAILDTYMYERRTLQTMYEKDGSVQKTILKLHEVFHVDGTEIERLIEKDGKPLSARDAAEEQKRVDKAIEKIRKESPSQRAKRRGETEKDRREEIESRREILDAFDFTLMRTEEVNGRPCWAIRGAPRAGFNGKGRRAEQLKKVAGMVWIDQQSYELSRMELDTNDTISFGWFLLRLQPGAKVHLQQTLVNNEVWLPSAVDVRADARMLGKMMRLGFEIRFDKFRKFTSDSKLIVGEQ